jgi:hypothetical protein
MHASAINHLLDETFEGLVLHSALVGGEPAGPAFDARKSLIVGFPEVVIPRLGDPGHILSLNRSWFQNGAVIVAKRLGRL